MNCPVCMDTITPDPTPLIYECGHSLCEECFRIETDDQKRQCMICKTEYEKEPHMAYRQLMKAGPVCTGCRFPLDEQLLPPSPNSKALLCVNCNEDFTRKKNFPLAEYFEENKDKPVCENEQCAKGVFLKSLKLGCNCEAFKEQRGKDTLFWRKSLDEMWAKLLDDADTLINKSLQPQTELFKKFKDSKTLASAVLTEITPIAAFWNAMVDLVKNFDRGMEFHRLSDAEKKDLDATVERLKATEFLSAPLADLNEFRRVLHSNRILSKRIFYKLDPIGADFCAQSKREFDNLCTVRGGLREYAPHLECEKQLQEILALVDFKAERFDEVLRSLNPRTYYEYRAYPFVGQMLQIIELNN